MTPIPKKLPIKSFLFVSIFPALLSLTVLLISLAKPAAHLCCPLKPMTRPVAFRSSGGHSCLQSRRRLRWDQHRPTQHSRSERRKLSLHTHLSFHGCGASLTRFIRNARHVTDPKHQIFILSSKLCQSYCALLLSLSLSPCLFFFSFLRLPFSDVFPTTTLARLWRTRKRWNCLRLQALAGPQEARGKRGFVQGGGLQEPAPDEGQAVCARRRSVLLGRESSPWRQTAAGEGGGSGSRWRRWRRPP